jgi:outer membrane receptor protein involved in Fe transport
MEWRKEQSSTNGDPIVQQDLTESAAQPDEVGGYEVFEGFAEVTIPILADMPFARELTFDAATRYASYTHSGHAEAWKTGLMWAPFDQLRIRGTYSEAVRAPNITEAFRPATPGFERVSDPCDIDNLADDPDRAGNCATLGLPANFEANDNVSVDTLSSGNRDLTPEESESITYGFIYEPSWLEGLSLTVDFYDIEIEDAILLVDAQDIVDNCVDASGGPDGNFCSLFTRDATTQDIDFVRSTFVNASRLTTEGYDINIGYTTDVNMMGLEGNFKVDFTGTFLQELDEFIFQNRPDELNVERGELGDPVRAFRATASYAQGPWVLGWEGRYLGNQKRYARADDICEDVSPCATGTTMYHDLTFRYFAQFDAIDVEFYGGINNVLDEEPPRGIVGIDGSSGNQNEAIYSGMGRYWFLGIRGML